MDAKKLGQFIAEIRKEKEMTQAELASKLHVTDKAVSKWERGLGLPDINSIEPLADALGISVAEVMQAERIPDDHVTQENASEMLTNAFDMVKQQRKLERKHHALILVGVLLPIALIFLGDTMGWMGMFFCGRPVLVCCSGNQPCNIRHLAKTKPFTLCPDIYFCSGSNPFPCSLDCVFLHSRNTWPRSGSVIIEQSRRPL